MTLSKNELEILHGIWESVRIHKIMPRKHVVRVEMFLGDYEYIDWALNRLLAEDAEK